MHNQTIVEVTGTSVKMTSGLSNIIIYLQNDDQALILYDRLTRQIHEQNKEL